MADSDVYQMCLLMLEDECSTVEFRNALLTLMKILRNVQSNPKEEKYRTIRTENKAFKEKVWKFEGCQQFLFSTGWVQADDAIILPEQEGLDGPISALESQLRLHEKPTTETSSNAGANCNDKESEEKTRIIQEERKRRLQQIKRDKEERKRINEQIKADRQEANLKEHKDIRAREVKFGSNVKKFTPNEEGG